MGRDIDGDELVLVVAVNVELECIDIITALLEKGAMAKHEEKIAVKGWDEGEAVPLCGCGVVERVPGGGDVQALAGGRHSVGGYSCSPGIAGCTGKRRCWKKRGLLNGDELRFLRKQLKVASKDFAPLVGRSSVEQYSRLENGYNRDALR